MSEFTKGPWRVNNQFETFMCIDSPRRGVVCDVDCDTDIETGLINPSHEQIANANLIAAAPDLYEALTVLRKELAAFRCGNDPHLNMADAALAKANGQEKGE